MAGSYQKVIVVGNVGNDPEARFLSNGDAVTNFSVAVSEKWKDSSGAQQERTEWFRCVAFKRLAEVAAEYLRKGSSVLVEGKLQTRKWTANDGTEKYAVELRVDQLQMLGSRQEGEQQRSNPSTGAPRQQRTNQRTAPARQSAPQGGGFDEMDDDVPF